MVRVDILNSIRYAVDVRFHPSTRINTWFILSPYTEQSRRIQSPILFRSEVPKKKNAMQKIASTPRPNMQQPSTVLPIPKMVAASCPRFNPPSDSTTSPSHTPHKTRARHSSPQRRTPIPSVCPYPSHSTCRPGRRSRGPPSSPA